MTMMDCRVIDFNPRLREGDDTGYLLRLWMSLYFNPRLREGDDSFWKIRKDWNRMISIHVSARETT